MNTHGIAEELAKAFISRSSNEANTRRQIIDRLLHEVLDWPVPSVDAEKYSAPGFIDYVLYDKAGHAVLLIEAKKEGVYFELPQKNQSAPNQIHFVRLKTLVTDPNIAAAVRQAVGYCPSVGAQIACITNGHEFIFFRSFVVGKDYLEVDALVIPSLQYFAERYTQAHNLLGYEAVTTSRSLQIQLGARTGIARELSYPKNNITHYDSPYHKNSYAKFMEPIAKRYFGEIPATDTRLMNNCYVFARDTKEVQAGIRKRVADSISPYFEADGASEISEVRTGGKLAQRIARSLSSGRSDDVLILYGGKGAGKSTFLRRLLYFDPPTEFTLHALPVIIDCLKAPQSKDALTTHFWSEITTALNVDGLLEREIDYLLKLFGDRYSVAMRQELAGFDQTSVEFIRERNRLVQEWKNDRTYVVKRLQDHWLSEGKKLVVAFDNTDQLTPVLQDHCFLSSQHIGRELQCTVIISMREERYCRARTSGVLDAYQNAGFHLASPDLVGVFTKRIRMVMHDLKDEKHSMIPSVLPVGAPAAELARFFRACLYQFEDEGNALRKFLQECSRDNTRQALLFFSQFLASGYTHVQEMVDNTSWTVISHQVVKPMMVPHRFNYDEAKSLIPNLYQCRTPASGSHFTMLRILRLLKRGLETSPDCAGYWRVDALVDEFDSRFGMRSDCESSLDVMLRHGLIEANNRLDSYSVEKSEEAGGEQIYADEVRITTFGVYVLDYLAVAFTYLELVSLDCGIAEQKVYSELCSIATDERNSGIQGDKMARILGRLKRVELFIQYLKREEERERTEYLIGDDEGFTTALERAFHAERPRVLASAKRNIDPVTSDPGQLPLNLAE